MLSQVTQLIAVRNNITQKPMETNKTAEEFVKDKYGVKRTSLDGRITTRLMPKFGFSKWCEIMEEYANQQTSTLQKENEELRTLLSGKTFFDEKEAMQSKIDQLKAKLQEADEISN